MMEIPGYAIVHELGKGGATTVYLAVQERLNRQVALKIMKPTLGEDDKFAERFIKEGRIVLQLKHPQIIALYDFNVHDGYYYFSMEFLPGGTLSKRIAEGLPVKYAITIVKLIAKALAYAHGQGIIHRNIKPKNILFRQDGTPVLSDFSIAKVLDTEATQLTTIGMFIESPLYMSPEQLEGKPLDARSDLYSLGIVFYEMLTRHSLLQADDFKLPFGFEELQPILNKLIAKNPKDRFENAEQFIAAVEPIEADYCSELESDSLSKSAASPVAVPSRALDSLPKSVISAVAAPSKTLNLNVLQVSRLSSAAVASQIPAPNISQPDYSKTALTVGGLSALAVMIIGGYWLMTHQQSPPSDFTTGVRPLSVLEDRSAAAVHYEQLAMEHFQRGEWDACLDSIELGLNAAPGDQQLSALRERAQKHRQAVHFLVQARERWQQGMLEESQKLIEQGLQQVPEQPELLKLRDQIEVHAKLEQIISPYADGAKDALDRGDLNKAEDYLAQLAKIQPDHPKLLMLKQDLQAKRDQVAAARRQAEEAARRQAAEELKRRMDAETKRRTEEEAKRQAVEETKRKAAERARQPEAEEPKRQTAVSEAGVNNQRRCGNILSRLTLGEPVSDGERTFLTQRCR